MTSCRDTSCPNFPPDKEVPYIKGSTNKIMWISDYPSLTDTYFGSLLSGEAGEYLDYVLCESDLSRSDLFVASAIRCHIDKKALPIKQLNSIMKCCQSKLYRAIKVMQPKIIIAAGELAAKQFGKSVGGVKKNRGLINNNTLGVPLLITYSPNFCVLNPSFQTEFERDIKLVKHFVDNNYEIKFPEPIVEQIKDLEEVLPEDLQSIAIDTETQGLDWLNPNSLLISFSVCFNNTHAYQIPLQVWADNVSDADYFILTAKKSYRTVTETSIPIKRCENFEKNLKLLGDIIENPKIKKYMFNGQFDLSFIYTTYKKVFKRDLQIQNFAIDVQALAHALDENLFMRSSLESARKHFSNFKSQYSVDFDKTFDKDNVILIPKDDLASYAALDAYTTFMTADGSKQQLLIKESKSLQNYFIKFVMPTLSYALPTLTMNGGFIDKQSIPQVKDEIAQLIQQTHKEAIDLIPVGVKYLPEHKTLKLSRNFLVKDTLYHKKGFGIKPPGFTKGGTTPSVSSEVRTYLKGAKIPKDAATFIEKYETWSMLNVLLTRYIKAFETNIRSDGRIHPTYSIITTATGRSSASNPSWQNLPKRSESAKLIRRLVIPEPGNVLLALDYSQNELRFMAWLSDDETMKQVYKDDGDIHTKTALAILGKEREEVDDTEFKAARRSAKSLNFGLLYGMSVGGFQRYAKLSYNVDLSYEESARLINVFFTTYPSIKDYHRKVINFARKFQYVQSPYGRKRRLPNINSAIPGEAARSERQALNHAIQAAASDTALVALNELLRKDILNPEEAKPIMFVHDELVFEIKESKVAEYVPLIQYEMENPPLKELFGINLSVPLKTDAQIGYNYADLSPYNAENEEN